MKKEKYKVLIVDENQEQIDDFINFFEPIEDFEVIPLNTLNDESELFEIIIDNEIDAVAFDYKLKENNSTFEKNGDAYQTDLLDNFENFPTFIITNNAADSKAMHTDPFKVIDKRIINFDSENEEQKIEAQELVEKVRLSIEKYKENLAAYEEELLQLIDRQNKGASLEKDEIYRMIELDTKLENSISKKSSIPKDWKSPAGLDAIKQLVENSQNILIQLKKINNAE